MCCVVLCCIALRCVVLFCVMLSCVLLCFVLLCCAVLGCVFLFRVVVCRVVLSLVVLCCIVLCCAVLCCRVVLSFLRPASLQPGVTLHRWAEFNSCRHAYAHSRAQAVNNSQHTARATRTSYSRRRRRAGGRGPCRIQRRHAVSNTPDPFRPPKLSGKWPSVLPSTVPLALFFWRSALTSFFSGGTYCPQAPGKRPVNET